MKLNGIFVALATGLMMATAPAAVQADTVGPGGFDGGWATEITFDPLADRGTNNGRDNALNALGAADNTFFEIGFGSTVDLTFGKNFNTSASVFEVTFNSVVAFPEAVELYVGLGGVFQFIGEVSNVGAQISDGGATVSLAGLGEFDTVRLIDISPLSSSIEQGADGTPLGGFDINAVRVAPVPLPASALLLLAGLGGLAIARRKAA